MNCSKGKILRKSYTRNSTKTNSTKTNSTKTNKIIKVKSGCIKAQSNSGLKTTDINKKILSKKNAIHKLARKKYGTPKCSKGQIIREGYKRTSKSNNTIFIPPVCIKSKTGKSTKSKPLFIIEKGLLDKYGYYNVMTMTEKERHKSLIMALKDIKPLSLSRRLNALATLNKNVNIILSKIFKQDSEWIKTRPEYINRNNI